MTYGKDQVRPTQLVSFEATETMRLLCQFFEVLISAEERLMAGKADFLELRFDTERRLGNKVSPISFFQRIDRAAKGHITRQDMLTFLDENGYPAGVGYEREDLKLVLKASKT